MNAITTTHNLDFEVSDWELNKPLSLLYSVLSGSFLNRKKQLNNEDIKLFRVGTCEGQWYFTGDSYVILSLINRKKGNGHFTDVLEWFEYSARRDNVNLIFEEIFNKKFKKHLIEKKGFAENNLTSVIKYFLV